jgi:transcriptional regulator with XRE-family HTH domain
MGWTVASDIAARIRNLREALGGGGETPLLQEDLGRRAGVRASQVSQWERGAQRPSRSRLERWAEREGWPVTIFQDGAPLPSELLGGPLSPPATKVTPEGVPTPGAGEILARFYEVMAKSSRQGRPCPPELAVLIQDLYHLATSGGGGEPDSRVVPSPRSASPSADDEGVPNW